MEKLERYDLNCNIFDVYNYDGLSMQELLCQFYTKINECVDLSNSTLDLCEWLVSEGLKQEVAIKLTNWLNDGTLENLINVTLFENLNKKIDDVTSQSEYINIKRFGAKGDGVTDDTNSIQSALEYCFENKRNLYFEDGEYITTKPLYFYVADNSFEPSVNIKGQSHHGVKINKINNKKDDVFGINSIITVVNGEFKRNNNVNIEGKFARNFEIKNISLISDNQADYGLYFPFTCVSSTLKNINITKVNEAGVKYKQGIYLCDLDRVRIQYSKKGFDLSEGLNTSLNIANCYCTNISDVAYDLKGNYSNLYNCCADGCEGTVFKFKYFIGSVNGCGAESIHASKIFDIAEYNNITFNGLYTWGNYDNAEATHIHIRGKSKAIFNNCRMMVKGNSVNSVALGTVYESGENCYLEFNSCDFGNYTNFTNSTQSTQTTVKISNLNGRIQYRENSMPSIGFDNYNELEINPLGNAIFTGLSDNHYTYVNGDNLDYKKPTTQGDIILTKNVYGTGCIGWVNAFDRKEDIYYKGSIQNIEGSVIQLDDVQLDIEGCNNIVVKEWTELKSSSGGSCTIRKTDLKEKTITVSNIAGTWNVGDRIFVPKGNNKSSQTLKIPVVISCRSNNRPNKSLQKGQSVFDENLGKPIWYNGSSWVDSTGATV